MTIEELARDIKQTFGCVPDDVTYILSTPRHPTSSIQLRLGDKYVQVFHNDGTTWYDWYLFYREPKGWHDWERILIGTTYGEMPLGYTNFVHMARDLVSRWESRNKDDYRFREYRGDHSK